MNKIATSVAAGVMALSPAAALAAKDSAKQLEANKALALEAQKLWDTGLKVSADDILAKTYVNHQDTDRVSGLQTMDRDAYLAVIEDFERTFSPSQVTIHFQVAEGDKVSTMWSNTITFSSEFMGVEPTNQQYTYHGIQIDRIEDGRIVESWVNWDKFDLFNDLGLVTLPDTPTS